MAKKPTKRITRFRDSDSGRFITERQADRRDPATWEKERIRVQPPKKK